MCEDKIIQIINKEKSDKISVSCTMQFNIYKVKSLIQAIKNAAIVMPVAVGGYLFNLDKKLWKIVIAEQMIIHKILKRSI